MPAISSIIAGIAVGVAAVGTSYSIASSLDAAGSAKDAANQQALLQQQTADEQAALEKQQAQEQALLIETQGEQLQAQQRAALAGSGVDVRAGGGGAVLAQTDRLADQDALTVLRGGQRRAGLITRQGELTAWQTRQQGQQLSDKYTTQAITSGITGFGSILGQASTLAAAGRTSPDIAAGKAGSGLTAGSQTYSGFATPSLLGGGNYFK